MEDARALGTVATGTALSPSAVQVHGWISLSAPCSWHAKNLKCGPVGWAGFLLVSVLNRQGSSAAREAGSDLRCPFVPHHLALETAVF